MTNIIDGKAFAAKIRMEVKQDSDSLISQKSVVPCLAVVLVGENPASKVYVGAKTKMAAECNIKTKDYKLDENTDQDTLLKLIKDLNEDNSIEEINGVIFEYDGEEQWQRCLSLATKQMVDNYF